MRQAFNSFLSKIRDENVTNFASFTVNSLASFLAVVVRLLQVKLLRRRKLFSRPALTANSSSLLSLTVAHICFSVAPDHFTGHPLVACPFADNPTLHVYLKLLARLLPPSTRQPGPVAVLLGQMLKLSLIFFANLSLSWGRQRNVYGCFSRIFLCT